MQPIIFFFGVLCFSAAIAGNPASGSNVTLHRNLDRVRSLEDYSRIGINVRKYSSNVVSDGLLTVPQLLEKYGYPVEVHSVKTDDDYILEMHRIPKPGGKPVMLMHGIFDSSGGWVITGPHTALGYFLADAGYDVWMGNSRGNRYSKNHSFLSVKSKRFWQFSFHEIGVKDLPAMIDHILKVTNFKKLQYVGHSQGTTSFFAMCSERPEYCNKIELMQALAPVAFLRYVRSPVLKTAALFAKTIQNWSKAFKVYELMPTNSLISKSAQILCRQESLIQPLCCNMIFLVTGYNTEQLNKTLLPTILGHIPAGASTQQILHYGQLVGTTGFRTYNQKFVGKFRKPLPKSYNLSKVTVPVILHYSQNDWISGPKDVLRLSQMLPNVLRKHLIPMKKFNHMDFLIGISSRKLVYEDVLNEIRKYDQL